MKELASIIVTVDVNIDANRLAVTNIDYVISMIRENLIALIDARGSSSNKRFTEFSERTGIKSTTLKAFYHGAQKLNNEQLDLINKAFPQYVYWLATGKALPGSGQYTPGIADEAGKYESQAKKAGTDKAEASKTTD